MKHPTEAQIDVAVLWLQSNEGEEYKDCEAVAAWLDHLVAERLLRGYARRHGITMATARKQLADSINGNKSP